MSEDRKAEEKRVGTRQNVEDKRRMAGCDCPHRLDGHRTVLGSIATSAPVKENGRRKGARKQQNVEIKRGSTNCWYFYQRYRTREAASGSKAAVCPEQEGMVCFDANEIVKELEILERSPQE